MSSFVTGGAARESAPETETETTPKQLFVRMRTPGQKLPPKQVLQVFFQRSGCRVVKIILAKEGTIAFVTFMTADEAKAALDAMNGHEVVDESNGVNLARTLFVDFACEKGTKPAHVQAPRPAPRPHHVEAQRSVPRPALRPAPRPAYVEAPRPEPEPRPAPPQKPVLDVASANLPMVYLFPNQKPRMMSNQAMGLLFDLGLSPETKFEGDTNVQIYGNGIQLIIPHPDHPSATQDCQKAFDSGLYFDKYTVKVPREVLTSKKFWRD